MFGIQNSTNYVSYRTETVKSRMAAHKGKSKVCDLLASAFSSALGSTVLTYDQYKQQGEKADSQALNIDQLFKVSHLHGRLGDDPTNEADLYNILVATSTTTRGTLPLFVSADYTIALLKEKIEEKTGLPTDAQWLICGSKMLQDGKTLLDYNIQPNSTIHVMHGLPGGHTSTLHIDDSFVDPQFDYDFTRKVDDGTKFYRGGHEYHRPYGWKRYAIKVLGKYEDDKEEKVLQKKDTN